MASNGALKTLVHAQTVVRGLLREIGGLVSKIKKAEEKMFDKAITKTTVTLWPTLSSAFEYFAERQSMFTTLRSLYVSKYVMEALDSMLESVEKPSRIPVVLRATIMALERTGSMLMESHQAEGLYLRIVAAELEGMAEAHGVEPGNLEESQAIVESILTSALQHGEIEARKRMPPTPLFYSQSPQELLAGQV